MVEPAMVRRVVHRYFANAAINMFQNGTNCTKDLHISNKSRTFAEVFIFELDFMLWSDTPRSDCAGCFVVYFAKKIVHFTKNQLFLKKKVEKIW